MEKALKMQPNVGSKSEKSFNEYFNELLRIKTFSLVEDFATGFPTERSL